MGGRRIDKCAVDRTKLAEDDLHVGVAELRRIGIGTYWALREIAAKLRITKDRARHLYYRDQPVLVDADQQHRIALGVCRVLDHLASVHMEAANRCHARAEEIKARQAQMNLPLGDECASGSSNGALPYAA